LIILTLYLPILSFKFDVANLSTGRMLREIWFCVVVENHIFNIFTVLKTM